jgi:hypothetical protein
MTIRQPETMILTASIEGMTTHIIGDELFHESLTEAIHTEAEATVESNPCWLLELLGFAAAVDLVAAAMTAALHAVGDRYQAVDGVVYELVDGDSPTAANAVSLPYMTSQPVVTKASFETLPIGSGASRRAIAHWSDGTHSEVLRWHDDEILSPVDHVGRGSEGGRTRGMPRHEYVHDVKPSTG